MKTLTLLTMAAAAALLPTAATAQVRGGGHVGGGGGFRGGFVGGGFVGGGSWGGGGWGGGVVIPRGQFRPGRDFPRRLRRGAMIHPYWFGPQFVISNWQGYGFANPGADRRWVRYYDDAYLIDRGGRVVDTREGLDWDQYGERWDMSDGVPSYYGRNDFHPGDEDYAYVEEQGRGREERHAREEHREVRGGRDMREEHHREMRERHAEMRGGRGGGVSYSYDAEAYGRGGAGMAYGGPMPMGPGQMGPGPMVYRGAGGTTTTVYGGGVYGYGYGAVAYPMVIETTTVTGGGGATYSEEIIEEVVQTRQRARRRARPCNCSRPRPPAGERG